MADQKDTKDQPRHGRDVTGRDDPARLRPFQMNEPRSQAEIVAEAYDIETPTPTQEENDQAKKDAMYQDPGSLDPQSAQAQAEAKRKKEMEAQRGQPGQGYQTRAATPKPE